MTDAGFANSSGAIPYLILLLLPTTLCILTPLIRRIYSRNYLPQTCNMPNTVYQTVYVNKPAKLRKTVNAAKPVIKQTEAKNPQTSIELIKTTKQALVKLGYKAKDAKFLVEKMCKTKCYTDEISLIQDCISYTHKNK
jgi:hypothetical protein